MNWEAVKYIYRRVLICNNKIEYLGEDKYKLISFYPSGEKHWEEKYQNRERHGKSIWWYKNGQKWWEEEYKNGKLHGKSMSWSVDGSNIWDLKYKTETN